MTNFTVSLGTFACGRDVYSPRVGCVDCADAYRRWLCAVQLPRCGEGHLAGSSSTSSSSPVPSATGRDGRPLVSPRPALVAQTAGTPPRNTNIPAKRENYDELLPCRETCTAVDRACPVFLGFKCPVVRYNADVSYGVGFVDSGRDGEQGGGTAGVAADRYGNVWCNEG
jgi:calcium channel MID1